MSASTGCGQDAAAARAAGGRGLVRSRSREPGARRGLGGWWPRLSPAAEEGQTLLLGIGLMAVVAALLLTVACVTAVYLDLKRLTSLADSAAAAAARGVGADTYYSGAVSSAGAVPGALTDAAVGMAAAEDVSAQASLVGLEEVAVLQAHALGGDTAVVTLAARSRPPFLPWGVLPSEGFEITATSTARVVVAGP